VCKKNLRWCTVIYFGQLRFEKSISLVFYRASAQQRDSNSVRSSLFGIVSKLLNVSSYISKNSFLKLTIYLVLFICNSIPGF